MQTTKVEISVKTLILSLVVLIALVVTWQLKEIVFMIFIAFILNSAFRPFVDSLEKRRIPRIISILIIYIVVFIVLGFLMANVVTEALRQLQNLLDNFPQIFASLINQLIKTFPWITAILDPESLNQSVKAAISTYRETFLTDGISGVFGFINRAITFSIEFFTIIVISVYMLERKESIYQGLARLVPRDSRKRYRRLLDRIDVQLGNWLRGQLIVMFLVGLLTWLVLQLPVFFFPEYRLHEFALPLAFIAGLLEAVPNLGPLITAVIATVIAAGFNPLIVIVYVIISFTLIQQIETAFISPTVMRKAIGIDPIVTIVAIISGATLFGVVGAILFVPIIAIGQIIFQFGLEEANNNSKK